MATITITNTGRKLFTLYPDGTDMVQLQDPLEFTKNSIGERKRMELKFVSSAALAGCDIFFDPALFLKIGSASPAPNAPTQSWYISAPSVAGTYDMGLTDVPSYSTDLYQNWDAKIELLNDGVTFIIHFEYFQIYDTNGFLDIGTESNKDKLTTISKHNLTLLHTVYTHNDVVPQFYIYISNPSSGDKGFLNYIFLNYEAAYYNDNPELAAPYFTLPVWKLEAASIAVSTLQLNIDTKVTFGITAPGVVDKIFVWLIKTSANDDTVDFITAYDASYLNVINDGTTNTLSNKIKAPSTAPTLNTGKYEVSFNVDYTKLAFGEKYRFVAVVYDSGYGGVEVNSFLSDEYIVTDLPKFDGLNYSFVGMLEDYESKYFGNHLTCVVEERMKSALKIGFDYNVFSDDIQRRLGLTVPNDIRRYLQSIIVEVYENDGTYINYFDRLIATQINPISYNIPNGMELNFITGELEVVYNFRNRYESWFTNIQSILISNGLPVPVAANQNWAGRDLRIKYSLVLFYDDYAVPFSDTVIFEQKLAPKDYSSDIEITNEDGSPILDGYYCSDLDEVCFQAKLSVPNPEDYYLITTFEPSQGNSPTLEEEDTITGELQQLSTPKILTQETYFSNSITGSALFCIIPNEFFVNSSYKISAIAKLKNICERITEDDFLRLEENNDIRLMENCY